MSVLERARPPVTTRFRSASPDDRIGDLEGAKAIANSAPFRKTGRLNEQTNPVAPLKMQFQGFTGHVAAVAAPSVIRSVLFTSGLDLPRIYVDR
jgi:hypothetical protein